MTPGHLGAGQEFSQEKAGRSSQKKSEKMGKQNNRYPVGNRWHSLKRAISKGTDGGEGWRRLGLATGKQGPEGEGRNQKLNLRQWPL